MEYGLQNIQIQKMTPQTMHSLQFLNMPLFALESYLGNIVSDNPYLEARYDIMETPYSLSSPQESAAYRRSAAEPKHRPGSGLFEFRDHLFSGESHSLYDYLLFQARLCSFSGAEAKTAGYIIANINNAGYLEESLDAVAAVTGVSLDLAEWILRVIQTFSPAGVGARNLSECLRLQAAPGTADYDVLIRILQDDLIPLADRKFTFLERKYKISRLRIQKILDYVQTLNPKPGSNFSQTSFAPYILPDASVSLKGCQIHIEVRGEAQSLLTFDPNYMADTSDGDAAEFLKQKKIEAAGLISSLNMRHRALALLVAYIADKQQAFFLNGAEFLRPMTQKKAAADIGMNPSTICRCLREKYINTPWGTFPLQYFFSNSIRSGDCPAEIARAEVGALIAAENKTEPLSDLNISEALSEKGISISRRTVAKYRAQLGFGGQSARIRYV